MAKKINSVQLKKDILADISVKKVLQKLVKIGEATDNWVEEITSLQITIPLRSLNTSNLLSNIQHILIENNLETQASRSRVVQLKMKAMKEHLTIKQALNRLRSFIIAEYSEFLPSPSITEKRNYVDSILEKWRKREEDLEFVIKIADVVIDDCNQCGFTLKRIQELLEQKVHDK